ncbi:toluene-4-monooxygenase system B family protein [Dactylosporangium sp. CA-092794]|uniref:toluene-4-monooxygenase system B family protein n=1 Tax=Dactylosporangium sp. CA-092794 TaxID=3239929 RepID=UPI003D92FDBF
MTETKTEEPLLVPLNAIFSDDYSELLLPIMSNSTIGELAEAVAAHSEGKRVRKQDKPKVVFHNGRIVPAHLTVAEAGIVALDHVRVEYQD